jgi:molybdenum cofactor synthesis domain-containing protein
VRTAAALVIGNELLSGKIADANVLALARALRRLGVQLRRVVMVLDELDTIAAEVRALSASHDWVVTSGGIGPTHDDVTVEAVARAFDAELEIAPEPDRMLRSHYGARITEGHLLMARVPAGARLVVSASMPWPTVVMRNVWILPGVPEIFRMKLPVLCDALGAGQPFVSMAVLTDVDEPELKPALDAVVAAHPDVDVGSYPRWGDASLRTKLTFDGLAPDRVEAARDAFVARLPPGARVVLE